MKFGYLNNIRPQCVKAIFNIIAQSKETTRLEISKKSGYSLATVGKVAEALQDMGIVTQRIKNKNSSGRKANALSLNRDHLIQILDFSDNNFSFSVYNLMAEVVDAVSFNYNDKYFYDENLVFFLKDISKYVSVNYSRDHFIGTGISLYGTHSSKEDLHSDIQVRGINLNNLKNLVYKHLEPELMLAESYLNSSYLYNIREIDNYKNIIILYCFIGVNRVNSALIINSEIVNGGFASPEISGHLSAHNGTSLEHLIKIHNDPEKNAWEFSCTVNNLLRVICPHVLFIESDIYNSGTDMACLIRKSLINSFGFTTDDLPKIIYKKHNVLNAQKGLAFKIRDQWIDKVILKEKELS